MEAYQEAHAQSWCKKGMTGLTYWQLGDLGSPGVEYQHKFLIYVGRKKKSISTEFPPCAWTPNESNACSFCLAQNHHMEIR